MSVAQQRQNSKGKVAYGHLTGDLLSLAFSLAAPVGQRRSWHRLQLIKEPINRNRSAEAGAGRHSVYPFQSFILSSDCPTSGSSSMTKIITSSVHAQIYVSTHNLPHRNGDVHSGNDRQQKIG